MSKGLTQRQAEILDFVSNYLQENGFPPSIREIGKAVKIGSLRGVTVHLDALQRKGYLERGNRPRSIKLLHPQYQVPSKARMLPLVGTIAAGEPMLADQNIEALIPVPAEMVRNMRGAFLLRVRGDSMIDEGIRPRDLVIIKPQEVARDRDLVAVLLGDEATVKRISYENSVVKLIASNPAYEPIEIRREDARIIGKVVGLIRDYEGMAF